MITTIVTAPAQLPVSLDEAKDHMRVTVTLDDGYIQGLIIAATSYVEEVLRRKLITQTWKLFMDNWPDGNYFELPYGQLQSVTHIKFTDSDDTVQTTFDEDDEWTSDTDSDPGRVVLKYGEVWPGDTLAAENPIETQFICGYGAHTPQNITGATNATPIVITIVGHLYVSGDRVVVIDVGGNTNANGTWVIEKVDVDTFKLLGSAGNAAYTTLGTSTEISVPEAIRQAIKILVSDLYENREENIVGMTVTTSLKTVNNLLYPHRLFGF